jgi:hypothetical protein
MYIIVKFQHLDFRKLLDITSANTLMMIESRRMRWAEHVARMGDMKSAYKILVGKPAGRRPV